MVPEERKTGLNRDSQLDVIGQIAVGLAHGIRNPLTVIKGYVQFCQSRPSWCTPMAFEIILREVECIEALISSLISLTRNKAIEKSPQNLNQILLEIFPAIQAEAMRHGLTAELFPEDNLPLLEANKDEMQQLIMLLARNGVEAMAGNNRLIIGTCTKADKVVLYVQDTGTGIAAEHLEKIFDPFYTTKDDNAGLGLAIGRSIVERHHGHIQIVSHVGTGTTVRVLFPLSEQRKEFFHEK